MSAQRSTSWDREAVADLERKLGERRREYEQSVEPDRQAEVGRCVAILEAMLPVYRQMARLMDTIDSLA